MTVEEKATATRSAIDAVESNVTSVTHADLLAIYDREYKRLLTLSKEELVILILGRREHVGILFG